jgi:glycosyltransferase involved in cell wall biosynthesis
VTKAAAGVKKNSGEVWAIYAGTLGMNYDLDTLLTAAATLKDVVPNLRIIIVGSGPRKERLLLRIQNEQLVNVMFLGSKTPEEISELYRICDLGIMGYSGDSTVAFPIKFFDYMAAGLPVLSSVPGELAGLLRERSIGIQYQAENADSLAKQMAILVHNEGFRALMALRCRAAAAEFDSVIQYDRFVDFAAELFRGEMS